MSSRRGFVTAETKTLDLPGGGWIEVKTRLNHGEVMALKFNSWGRTAMKLQDGGADIPEFELDMARAEKMRWLAWIVDWALVDDHDKPVRVTEKAFASLREDVAAEIEAVLSEHIAAMEREQAEEPAKNVS